MEVSVVDPDASHENSRHASRRRIIEEDEYIEACKCILELIRIHPEACKERESRHGCLPLHLCVFSMCATPPPPVPTVVNASNNSGKGGRGHHRTNSSGGANSNTKSKRPPVASSRSVSAPLGTTKPPTTPSNHSNSGLPMQQLHVQHPQSGKAGHRSVHSNSSADFSLGNISQMIQEESEHQQALTDHQRSTKNLNSNSPDASPGAAGGSEEVAAGCGGSIEDQIYQGMEDMERLLIGLESKYEMKEDKKKRDKRLKEKNKDVELVEQELTAAIAATAALPSATTTTTTTTVVNAMTPMDSLEEQSRETDSHSTPQVGSGSRGNSSNESSNGIVSDGRTGASVEVVREGEVPKKLPHNNAAENSKPSKVDTPSGSAHSIGIKNSNNNNNKPIQTTTTSTPSIYSSAAPTYEELQRRYLQINTLRRDEYSVRVLNALLDAWPKSIKTSSEGGRLPLHMACFGKATVKVMETILKAYPDAARQRNHDGFLPVHIAAHWGVSHPDIAPLILRAYPDGAVGRNRWERTPIEEALGMAGENGRPHQLSLVWSLRRHPTYWIHNDVGSMLAPRNVRMAPWRLVETGETLPGESVNGGGDSNSNMGGLGESRKQGGGSVMSRLGGGAVDVDEVGSSDEEDEGVEVQMAQSSSSSPLSQPPPSLNDPAYIRALAQSTELSLLITKDKHWKAASLRCRSHPHEAREALEVKVRGAYTARITPLHYACENHPTVEVVRTLIEACPVALERRQEPGGQLPLHAACTWGASSEVVSTLLAARPSTAEMKDFLSNLPLHCACYSGAETVVVAALLRAYPQGVWPRNHQGSSAVDIVRRLSHPNRREVLGLLERTMGRLLERATAGEEEGVEVDQDNSLEWV